MKNFLKPTRITWAAFTLYIFVLIGHILFGYFGMVIAIIFGAMKGGSHAYDYVEFIAHIFQHGFNVLFYPIVAIERLFFLEESNLSLIILLTTVIPYSYIASCFFSWFFSTDWTQFSSPKKKSS